MRTVAGAFVAFLVLLGVWVSWFAPSDNGGVRSGGPPRRSISSVAAPLGRAQPRILVQVPRVTGLHSSFAKYLLRDTNLRPGRIRLESSPEPWGSIISQSIAPGSPVRFRTHVDLVVAKGSVPRPCRLYWCSTGGAVNPRTGSRPTRTRSHHRTPESTWVIS